jgi:hypothetical protein
MTFSTLIIMTFSTTMFSITTLILMTFCISALIMTFSITTLIIMTFSIATLIITMFSITTLIMTLTLSQSSWQTKPYAQLQLRCDQMGDAFGQTNALLRSDLDAQQTHH